MNNFKILTYLQLHIFELKYNFYIILISFIYIFITTFFFSNQLIYIITNILINNYILNYFIYTNITELFTTNIFISFFISLFIIFQLSILQFWFFFLSGFYKYENLKILKLYFIFLIFNLFLINILFIQIIPNILSFFININFSNTYLLNIYFEPKFNNYFYFIFITFIYIYISYICLYIFIYILFKQINLKTIINLRKFIFLQFILLSAIVSPPDIISQIFFLFFFIIFFEIYLFLYLLLYSYIF